MEKENFLHQQQHQQQYQHRHTSMSQADDGCNCHNCGARLEPGARFCEECGAPQGGANACPSCGAAIKAGMMICPVCGNPCTTKCTFCGSEMSAGETFCPECGNPRGGITCPDCGTLNFRSFCRKCNRPLNPMAMYAVEQTKSNPHLQRAAAISKELDEIALEIKQLEQQMAVAPEATFPVDTPQAALDVTDDTSDDTMRLLDEFSRLTGAAPAPKAAPKPAAKAEVKKAPGLSLEAPNPDNGVGDIGGGNRNGATPGGGAAARLEQLKALYSSKLDELQKELDSMIPDPGLPPEIQRNQACAFKYNYEVTTTHAHQEQRKIAWVCNLCGCHHSCPSECAQPELGGTWITKNVTVYTTTTTQHQGTINL